MWISKGILWNLKWQHDHHKYNGKQPFSFNDAEKQNKFQGLEFIWRIGILFPVLLWIEFAMNMNTCNGTKLISLPPPSKKNGAHLLKWMNKAISAVLASQLVKMFEKPHLTFWTAIGYIKTLSLIQRMICGECSYTILKKKKLNSPHYSKL